MTRVGLTTANRGYVNIKITSIIIDQTRTAGKWYVREIPNKTGDGIAPVFFRREKTDLVGRLIDKAKGVQSAQRYAAKHMHDLHIAPALDTSNIASEALGQKGGHVKKLENKALETFLHKQAGCVSSTPVNLKVTVINKNQVGTSKTVVEELWKSCTHSSFDDKSNKSQKKEFIRLLNQSLDLSSGRMATNDPSVRTECATFVKDLSNNNNSPFHWTRHVSEAAQNIWSKLENDILQTATPVGKNMVSMNKLLSEISSSRSPEESAELEYLLKAAFQIYYENQTSLTSSPPQPLPWKPLEFPQKNYNFRDISLRLITCFKALHPDYGALGDVLRQAVEARLGSGLS
jgi:hypothetical protein